MEQLIFDFANDDYPSFDKFLGTANAELVHMLHQQAHGQFVYVWGKQGSGKSHLLRAWVAQFLQAEQNAVYVAAGQSLATNGGFEAEYLAVDQIDRLCSTGQALLFEIFNRFRNRQHGFLLLSADVPPHQLNIREDLRTRMGYCLVYEVKPLSDEEKLNALVSMAAGRQLVVGVEIFHYLLRHWRRDMDSLIQMLDILERHAVIMGRRITLPFLQKILKEVDKGGH